MQNSEGHVFVVSVMSKENRREQKRKLPTFIWVFQEMAITMEARHGNIYIFWKSQKSVKRSVQLKNGEKYKIKRGLVTCCNLIF